MKLVQFNTDVDSDLKKRVRKDSVDFNLVHAVISNAVFADFFKRYPRKGDRRKLYAEMERKVKGANGVNGVHAETTT